VAALLIASAVLFVRTAPPRPGRTIEGQLQLLGISRDGTLIFYERVGRRGADGERDSSVCVAESRSGEELFALPYEKWCMFARSPDDRYLAVRTTGNALDLVDLPARRRYAADSPPEGVADLHFSPSGTFVIAGVGVYLFGPARVLESATGRRLLELQGSCEYEGATPAEELILNRRRSEGQQVLEIWDVSGQPRVRRFDGLRSRKLSPDGRSMLVEDLTKAGGDRADRPMAFLDVATGSIRPLWRDGVEGESPLTSGEVSLAASFSPDGRLLTVFPPPGDRLDFWDVSMGRRTGGFARRFRGLFSVEFLTDGRRLVTKGEAPEGSDSLTVMTLWDFDAEKPLFAEGNWGMKDVYWYAAGWRFVVWHPDGPPREAKVVDAATGGLQGQGWVARPSPFLIVPVTSPPGWDRLLREAWWPGEAASNHRWRIVDPGGGAILAEFSTPYDLGEVQMVEGDKGFVTAEGVSGSVVLRYWDRRPSLGWAWPLLGALVLGSFLFWMKRWAPPSPT
jgi:hypothetical protein